MLSIVFSLCLHLAGRQGWLDSNTVYGAPLLPWIVVATSFATVIVGFRSTKAAIAERNFDQRRLVQIELGSQLVSLVAMVGVGTLTHSIWALVLGQWLGAIVSTVLSHTALPGHRDWFAWDEEALREILRFGRWVFVSSFIGVFALQADRIVLSGLVPAAVLGQYAIASTIVGAIQGVFNKLYSTVAMPALSETARTNRSRLREVFYRVRVPTDLALLLSAGMLAATGGWVIEILYDQRYRDAGWMLRILAISLPWIRFGADLQLYLALGMPKYVAIINGMRFAAVFVAVPVGFHLWGVPGAIWGFSLHQLVTAVLSYRFNSRLHIVDVGREVAVLFALPLGYAAGLSLLLLK